MPAMTVGELASEMPMARLVGPRDLAVRGLAIDSRAVEPGWLFAAFPGIHTDGHRFVEQALERGAVAVLHSSELPAYRPDRAYLRAADTRRAFSAAAAAFYGHPDRALRVAGVTGTDGKSTTVWMIQQLLEMAGQTSGFLSSVGLKTSGAPRANPHHTSTPEAHEVHRVLAEIRDAGCRYAVVEATSHGLAERTARLADVRFDVAVLTNVTEEHREFHGSLEQYRRDKSRLFASLKPLESSCGVANRDDPHWRLFAEAALPHPTLCYSLHDPEADLAAFDVEAGLWGSRFLLRHGGREMRCSMSLPGRHNVENLLAALLATAALTGVPVEELAGFAQRLTAPAGRLQRVDCGQDFEVFVDFAHTPEAFRKVLGLVREHTRGRLIVVFGSAGERDVEKRPAQGRIASQLADLVVLTDEDPRGEDREGILRDIAAGCTGPARVHRIPDRREALRLALAEARAGDVVMCLGKGHEKSIEYADGPMAWDEQAVVEGLLHEILRGHER